jgi:hypothetical protein
MLSGRGFGQGFGFRGYAPLWPYVGRGRGGLPRCWASLPASPFVEAPADRIGPYLRRAYAYRGAYESSQMRFDGSFAPDQELEWLKNQAQVLRQHLDHIDARVKELEK